MKNSTIIVAVLFICVFLITASPTILRIHAEYPTLAHLYFGQTLAESSEFSPNPYPDEINIAASSKKTSFETYGYGQWGYEKTFESVLVDSDFEKYNADNWSIKRSYEERRRDSLRITKRNGAYYWDSNEGTELVAHTTDKIRFINGVGIYTIFIALDGSGVIAIRHDEFPERGFCPKLRDYAMYREIKVNKREIYWGYGGYYPPKPANWCDRNY